MHDAALIQIAFRPTLALQQDPGVLGANNAQPSTPGAGSESVPGTGGGAPPPGGMSFIMPIVLVMMVFLVLSTMMSGRKEKKKRAEMLSSIRRRDRVQTIGGMIGNIVEIKGDEYLLETDRASNSRAWVAKSAVSTVVKKSGERSDEPAEVTSES